MHTIAPTLALLAALPSAYAGATIYYSNAQYKTPEKFCAYWKAACDLSAQVSLPVPHPKDESDGYASSWTNVCSPLTGQTNHVYAECVAKWNIKFGAPGSSDLTLGVATVAKGTVDFGNQYTGLIGNPVGYSGQLLTPKSGASASKKLEVTYKPLSLNEPYSVSQTLAVQVYLNDNHGTSTLIGLMEYNKKKPSAVLKGSFKIPSKLCNKTLQLVTVEYQQEVVSAADSEIQDPTDPAYYTAVGFNPQDIYFRSAAVTVKTKC